MKKVMSRMTNKERKGFSLVELVVVILIIAILAAAIFLGGATVITQSRESSVRTDLRNYGTYAQDMMYAHPEIQSDQTYKDTENYIIDPTDGSASFALGAAAADPNAYTTLPVLSLLNEKYLTEDFKLTGAGKSDSWSNAYLYSYKQTPAAAAGESSKAIIIVSSMGANGKDNTVVNETAAGALAAKLTKDDGVTSAADFVKTYVDGGVVDTKDDYGVVVYMCDGAVSTAFYGF